MPQIKQSRSQIKVCTIDMGQGPSGGETVALKHITRQKAFDIRSSYYKHVSVLPTVEVMLPQ